MTPNPSSPSSGKSSVRSYSQPFSAGVDIERSTPPTDNDLITVVVRLNSPFRRKSVEPCDELPSRQATKAAVPCQAEANMPLRPPHRSFLKRLGTRWHAPNTEDKYKAVKMPRREYKRHFAHDKYGNYIGTEPERQWDEVDVMREFGAYRDVPLRTVLC